MYRIREIGDDMGNYGSYQNKLETNGRIVVPSKFKDNFYPRFFLHIGLDNVLEMWNEQDFIAQSNLLNEIEITDIEGIKFKRMFFQRSTEVVMDEKGRIKIPREFIVRSTIEKDVVFVGNGKKVEIWAKEKQEQFSLDNNDDAYTQAAMRLFKRKTESNK